jgi:hypothetical protein
MIVRSDTKRWAALPFSPTASSWNGATPRDACLSASVKGTKEDAGFEDEIILQENVFAFPIEDAQDLDFIDQPKLSPEEIAEGAVWPENVIGSYAV